jgi:anti-sigma factor RsiW
LRHERTARRLSEYLDGTLSGRDGARVEAHLALCPECRNDLVELRRTSELLRGLRAGVESPDLAASILERIRAGEAEPTLVERLRASAGRFFSGAWGAPLATAAVGLAVLVLVPRIEIEVSIPGGSERNIAAPIARAPTPRRAPVAALAARRVNESPLRETAAAARRLSGSSLCWEQPSFEACQEQRDFMELALRDTRAFVERVEAVPPTQRERWIDELSRFAAESGSATSVAERLRATDDPRAWQMATQFDVASFDGR